MAALRATMPDKNGAGSIAVSEFDTDASAPDNCNNTWNLSLGGVRLRGDDPFGAHAIGRV
jgi:hypothetical protein